MCWGSIEEVNKRVNSFLANVSSLYTPENTRKTVFWCFHGCIKKRTLTRNTLIWSLSIPLIFLITLATRTKYVSNYEVLSNFRLVADVSTFFNTSFLKKIRVLDINFGVLGQETTVQNEHIKLFQINTKNSMTWWLSLWNKTQTASII